MAKTKKYEHAGKPSDHPPIQIWKKIDGAMVRFKETYKTYADAAKAIGGDVAHVRKCALGKAISHKGYTFRFDDSEYHRDEIEKEKESRGRDYSGASSRYPGVYWYVRTNRWCAYVYDNSGKRWHVGTYLTEKEAIEMQKLYCELNGYPWPISKLHW